MRTILVYSSLSVSLTLSPTDSLELGLLVVAETIPNEPNGIDGLNPSLWAC